MELKDYLIFQKVLKKCVSHMEGRYSQIDLIVLMFCIQNEGNSILDAKGQLRNLGGYNHGQINPSIKKLVSLGVVILEQGHHNEIIRFRAPNAFLENFNKMIAEEQESEVYQNG